MKRIAWQFRTWFDIVLANKLVSRTWLLWVLRDVWRFASHYFYILLSILRDDLYLIIIIIHWLVSRVPLFVLSILLSSLSISRTGSASDWCALQEALYKCIDTIHYNVNFIICFHNPRSCAILVKLYRSCLHHSLMSSVHSLLRLPGHPFPSIIPNLTLFIILSSFILNICPSRPGFLLITICIRSDFLFNLLHVSLFVTFIVQFRCTCNVLM